MSFDLKWLAEAVDLHGRVVRVVVAEIKGSVPREVGASMLVWPSGQSGTIGGGALELDATLRARRALDQGDWLERFALGPGLGQCCGGAVTLLAEVYDQDRLGALDESVVLRRVSGNSVLPLGFKKQLSEARNSGKKIMPQLASGWMIEPVVSPSRHLWIFGAGHVGRAIVSVVAPMPDIDITWIDCAPDRFPDKVPAQINKLLAVNPAELVRHAPANAEHLVLTYSHALDLEICHRLLSHGFRAAGLIGSKTKWARFRKQLRNLGHSDALIDRISCPIGQPHLGKHPQAIAVGVAAGLLSSTGTAEKSQQRVG